MHRTSTQQEVFLPPELLTRVLQRLSQRNVLGSCSLVSKDWKAVAPQAAAARGIEIKTCLYSHLERARSKENSLLRWLEKHGLRLTNMQWSCFGHQTPVRVYMPYQQLGQLQRLHLSSAQLSPYPVASRAISAADRNTTCQCEPACPLTALTSLTRLELSSSGICNGGLCCLSALKALQQLELCHTSMAVYCAALPAMMQLTQLTSLCLTAIAGRVADGRPLQFSSLQPLQVLRVSGSPEFSYNDLPSLTTLAVSLKRWNEAYGEWIVSSSTTPGIARLTSLLELKLQGVKEVDPAMLAGLEQLRRITLQVTQSSQQSLMALLAVLPGMQHLEHLEVTKCGMRWVDQVYDCNEVVAVDWQQLPAACCLANLTSLVFKNMSWPDGVVQHIFGAGWQFPALRQLELAYGFLNENGAYDDDDHGQGARLLPPATSAPLAAADLAWLANRWPALQHLDVSGAVQPGVDLFLDKFSSLTYLAVAGEAINDRTSCEIGQLAKLKVLRLADAPNFTDAGLVCLTRLTRLQSVTTKHANFSFELDPRQDHYMCLQAPGSGYPTGYDEEVSLFPAAASVLLFCKHW